MKESHSFSLERKYLPVFLMTVPVGTAVWWSCDWPGDKQEEAGAEAEAETSGGSALFPINDLARSRHCSASLNIRSPSTATISFSSEARTDRKRRERTSWERIFLFITWHWESSDSISCYQLLWSSWLVQAWLEWLTRLAGAVTLWSVCPREASLVYWSPFSSIWHHHRGPVKSIWYI